MASEAQDLTGFRQSELSTELAGQWRRLTWAATAVALLMAPALVVWLNQTQGWSWLWSILAALGGVVVFRGLVDLVFHRLIPRPSLFGLESQQLREEDVVARRRVWFWRFWLKVGDPRRDHRPPDPALRELRGPRAGPAALRRPDRLHGHELPHPLRAAARHEPLADPGLRAGRRRVGREARRRARAGGGEGGGAARRRDLAVRRGVRARGRQARARPALPRRAGHGEDDAREGARDRLQLAVRLDPRLRLRRDVHRHRRDRRPRPRPPREAPREEVGRPVHRLHRRDRRRRHAAERPQPRARRRCGRARAGERPRAPLVRADRRPQPVWRPHPREPPVARAPLRRARAAGDRRLGAPGPAERNRRLHVPGRDGRRRLARAQPAARRHGRDRQPAVLQEARHEQAEHAARRHLHRPADDRKAISAHPWRSAAEGADLLHRRDERPRRAARPGAYAARPHGTPRLVPDADEAGPSRHPRPLHREGRRTTRSSTPTTAARRSPA